MLPFPVEVQPWRALLIRVRCALASFEPHHGQRGPTGRQFEKKPTPTAGRQALSEPTGQTLPTLRTDRNAHPDPQSGTLTQMVDAFGVGLDIAAQMLITAGDNADRVRSEAAFAKMCGVAPIPTGSGKNSGRHRLNRGGNRQANAALYRAVIVRMRWHAPTIAYVEKRTADGLSKKDIIRCLIG
jgi:hypothetical protein